MPATVHRPRGHIETLGSGHHRVSVYAGLDPLTGQEHRLRETCNTYAEAEVALTRLQRQVDERQNPKSAITVGEAIDQWLEVAKLAELTRDRYEDLIRLNIRPHLGHLQAGRLDAELLERFYARLERCTQLCGVRPPKGHVCTPLSSSTTRKIHYILRGALECAVRWKYLGVNPAALAQAPVPARAKPDPPSATEVAALLNEAWQEPEWGLLLWLTMVTGCRRGELCALRWRHVDFARSTLWIKSAIIRSRAGVKEKDTKTSSERRISIDPLTLRLLMDHRGQVATQLVDLGCELTDDTFIFSTTADYSRGRLPDSVGNRYRLMAKRLKLRSTRLHALRHYSATELLAAGVDLRTVAGRLGHGGGGTTTLKVNAAWVEAADRKAAETMASIMPPAAPAPTPKARGPYVDIATALREDIASGRLKPGDRLPTVVQLASQFTVAAGTAHRAMALLHDQGLITVQRGKRAIVA